MNRDTLAVWLWAEDLQTVSVDAVGTDVPEQEHGLLTQR